MKNRTIAKLLVCSTVLANLPVAAMANEVQNLANEPWYLGAVSDGQNGYVYNVTADTTGKVLWVGENQTYSIDADVAVKIAANQSVALGSNLETTSGNRVTIEGNGKTSVFNMANKETTYAIDSDVTFKNVAVTDFTDTQENRKKVTIEGTVSINNKAVVAVTVKEAATNAGVTVTNGNGDFASVGYALEGDVLTVPSVDGYKVLVNGTALEGNTCTVGTEAVTITVEEEAQDWVQNGDQWELNPEFSGTELEVPANGGTYIIPSSVAANVANITDVKVGSGSILRIESGVTFNNEITFALGGRLIAQTTNFKGQVWFTALTSNTRVATLAAENSTVELEDATFNKKVTIAVPTTTTAGETKFNGGAQVDAALTVANGSTLEIASSVSGTGSIASEGTLNVTSGTVETAIAVNGGTTTVAENATVGEVNVTAGSATVNGTANKVVVTGDATLTLGSTSNVDAIEATNPDNVTLEDGANYSKFGIQFTGENGKLEYSYNGNPATTIENNEKIYIITKDTMVPVTFNAVANENYELESLTINGQQVTNGSVYNVESDVDVKAVFTLSEGETPEPGEDQVAYTVNIGEGGSVTYELAGDADVKTLTSGSVNLTKGGSYTLNVTAAEGHEIDAVTVDGVALTGTNGAYQFTAKSEGNGSIAVTFKTSGGTTDPDEPGTDPEDPATQVTYTASIDEGGSVTYQEVGSTAEAVALKDGESVTLTKGKSYQLKVEADSSYEVDAVKVNGSELEEKDGVYTFTAGDADGAIAVTFSYVGGGSIGGGGSGGGSTGGGSSTSGTTSTVTVSANTSVSGKIMTATVSASNMEKAIKDVLALAEKNDTIPVVKISLSLGANIEGISVNLPTEALKALAAVSNAKLTIESSIATVTFDAKALSDILSQAGETFTLNAGKADMSDFTAAQLLGAGEGSVFDINITSDGTAITNFSSGSATVTLPYTLKSGENASDIVVYYMADNGILDSQSTQYDAANRKATFTTTHFSIYVVDAAWANPFNDVYEGDWFYNAVRYANENSLMAGVSDTTFAPNMNLTRAMVVQMLYSLEGKPAVVSGGNFTDVKASDWYADAVNWAASKGIVSGYSETTYAPNDSVTREQLSLILYKYAQSKNVTVNDYSSLSGFVDAAKTSDWAEDAVEWAVGAGLISSTSTSNKTLDPTGTATRAQVAQIVANFVEQVM